MAFYNIRPTEKQYYQLKPDDVLNQTADSLMVKIEKKCGLQSPPNGQMVSSHCLEEEFPQDAADKENRILSPVEVKLLNLQRNSECSRRTMSSAVTTQNRLSTCKAALLYWISLYKKFRERETGIL